jgi:hypothetical protein
MREVKEIKPGVMLTSDDRKEPENGIIALCLEEFKSLRTEEWNHTILERERNF